MQQMEMTFVMPRWEELPTFDLYMDQVLGLVSKYLGTFSEVSDEGGLITKTMINNYVKQKLVSSPENKKYTRPQLAFILVISLLKRVLSITEIAKIKVLVLDAMEMQPAYNLFCDELESALQATFSGTVPDMPLVWKSQEDTAKVLIRATAVALANKAYAQAAIRTVEEDKARKNQEAAAKAAAVEEAAKLAAAEAKRESEAARAAKEKESKGSKDAAKKAAPAKESSKTATAKE